MDTPDVNSAVECFDIEPGYLIFRGAENVPIEARPRFKRGGAFTLSVGSRASLAEVA